jgi:hypothetical protein
MQIVGDWLVCDDGVTRPVLRAQVRGVDGQPTSEHFLVDSGADRTVFGAALLRRLQLPTTPPPPGMGLVGVGGASGFVVVNTMVELTRDDGGPARIQGEFAVFTDLSATDLSVLGRDVLDHFDVILSKRRRQVLLLAPSHQYCVVRE